jgi:transcription initiation factor TFIID TATA-box-binding protein
MATIQNIIATCNVCTRLDLSTLAHKLSNIEYNKNRFTAAIMRIKSPRSTSLIFESGRLVILGTKSEEDALIAARRHCKLLQKIESLVVFSCFKICNIVCTVNLGKKLDLCKVLANIEGSYWEPEIFPGLKIYPKLFNDNTVCNVFESGKIVITGCPDFVLICHIVDYLYDALEQFCKE